MRRIVALLASLVLSLSIVGPVLAQGEPEINYITVTSATIDRTGVVTISGTMWCSQPMDVSVDWGDVSQVLGRKVTLHAGFGFWIWCNGTTPWQTQTYADPGKFVAGWARIGMQVSGANWCDEDPQVNPDTYCGPHANGGMNEYVKIVRAK